MAGAATRPARGIDRPLTGPVAAAAETVLDLAATTPPGTALLLGGETTVELRGDGRGGRNQELALRVALLAEARGVKPRWHFLSGGTDGRDGPTEAAGAIVDDTSLARMRAAGADPEALLANSDSHAALSAVGRSADHRGDGHQRCRSSGIPHGIERSGCLEPTKKSRRSGNFGHTARHSVNHFGGLRRGLARDASSPVSLPVLVAVVLVVGLSGLARAERVALVIGNSEYSANPLINPVNDAVDMAERLAEIGYRVHGDGPLLDVDLRDLQVAIRDFTRSLNPGDLAVFYFAGHGVEYKGTNYLIPTDDEEIQFADDVPDWSYPAPRLLERLAATGATGVIILDACRNNPLPERGGSRDVGIGLSAMDTPAGASAFIMYAAAPGQTSSDGEGRNGLFTGALLQALDRPDRRIDDIMYEVSFAVRTATEGRQVPWLEFAFAGEIPPQLHGGSGRTVTNEVPVQVAASLGAPGKPGRGIAEDGDPLYGLIGLDGAPPESGLRLDLLAGGYEDAAQLGGACHGFVARDPDFRLDREEAMGPLSLTTDSEVETVLVLHTPDGDWICAGTSANGAPPVLPLPAEPAGTYRIWVGTERQMAAAPEAELLVRALDQDARAGSAPAVAPPDVPDAEVTGPAPVNPAATIERALD